MQLFNKNKTISMKEADELLEKYYEGFTSAEEERQLHAFLSQTSLPERYDADRAMMGYFAGQKETSVSGHKSVVIPMIRWTSVAAAIIGCVFVVKSFVVQQPRCYAYIDGAKITDMATVKAEALQSIQDITPKTDEVAQTAKQFKAGEIIKDQLSVFSENQ